MNIILAVALLAFNVKSFELDSDIACPNLCTKDNCKNEWSNAPEHKCSAYNKKGASVDPWLLAEPRCQESTCDQCGNQQRCVRLCKKFKRDNGFAKEDYPNCDDVCESSDKNYKCFIDMVPPIGQRDQPVCWPNYPCSEKFCSNDIGDRKQRCSAVNIAIDPWNCVSSNPGPCAIKCQECGNQEICVERCAFWQSKRGEDDIAFCEQECRAVQGYKCFKGCTNNALMDNLVDVFAADIGINLTDNSSGLEYIWNQWGVGILCVIFILCVAMYKYCGHSNNKATELSPLKSDYGTLAV